MQQSACLCLLTLSHLSCNKPNPTPKNKDTVVIYFYLSSLIDYTTSEPDPLMEGIRKQDNPFIKKSSCTIL